MQDKSKDRSVATRTAFAAGLCLLGMTGAFADKVPDGKRPRELHVVSTTLVQNGPATVTAGSRYSFYDADSGDDTGNDLWDCTSTNDQGDGICYGQFNLSRGTISATTVGNLAAPTFSAIGEITGGTGTYAGAKDKIVASGTLAETPFTFYFRDDR